MLEYKRDGWKAAICLAPSLLLICIFTFWPIINSFIMAFLNNYYFALNRSDIYNSLMDVDKSFAYFMGGRFTGIGIQNFITLFRDKDFLIALKNTAFIVFVSVPVTVIIALLIAVALNSIKGLRGFFQTVFFLLRHQHHRFGFGFQLAFPRRLRLDQQTFQHGWHVLDQQRRNLGRAMFVLFLYSVWDGLALKLSFSFPTPEH